MTFMPVESKKTFSPLKVMDRGGGWWVEETVPGNNCSLFFMVKDIFCQLYRFLLAEQDNVSKKLWGFFSPFWRFGVKPYFVLWIKWMSEWNQNDCHCYKKNILVSGQGQNIKRRFEANRSKGHKEKSLISLKATRKGDEIHHLEEILFHMCLFLLSLAERCEDEFTYNKLKALGTGNNMNAGDLWPSCDLQVVRKNTSIDVKIQRENWRYFKRFVKVVFSSTLEDATCFIFTLAF